jgi:hypothetical protein
MTASNWILLNIKVNSVASGKPKLVSGGSMVAKLKLKGIDGRSSLEVEFAA